MQELQFVIQIDTFNETYNIFASSGLQLSNQTIFEGQNDILTKTKRVHGAKKRLGTTDIQFPNVAVHQQPTSSGNGMVLKTTSEEITHSVTSTQHYKHTLSHKTDLQMYTTLRDFQPSQ